MRPPTLMACCQLTAMRENKEKCVNRIRIYLEQEVTSQRMLCKLQVRPTMHSIWLS